MKHPHVVALHPACTPEHVGVERVATEDDVDKRSVKRMG